MARDCQPAGTCPKCTSGTVYCTSNHFQRDTLVIDSWEHKCPDCGHRETTAFRSDDPALDAAVDPRTCPYCGRQSG